MTAVLGIDLGRASCSAFVQPTGGGAAGEPFSLHIEPIVALSTKNEWLVGEDARRAAASGGGEAVWDLLALQGRKVSDLTTAQLSSWPFKLVAGVAGKALVEFHARPSLPRTVFAPEELLAVLLARLRQLAEQRAGCRLDDAVLTIPASCNYTSRQAIRDACAMAGLNARRLVVSSTAAGLAHLLPRGEEAVGQLVLIVDFGAGSVDVSLVSLLSASSLEVKATAGDATVGGVVLTERMVGHFLRDCSIQAAVPSSKTLNRLRRASQLAKKILTTSDVASVQLQVDSGPFAGTITRAQFEAVCSDCWDRIAELIQLVMAEGHVTVDQLNTVLLCGGSAVVPAVSSVVRRLFPTTQMEMDTAGELQARGAALLAASLVDTTRTSLLLDVTPLAFGVQRYGSKDVTILIPANVRVPAKGDNVFFVGGHVAELAYHVLEGRCLRQAALMSGANAHPHGLSVAVPHCVGTIRALRAPLTLTTAPKPVVTKLTIAFDLTEDLTLTASIADLTTKQPTTTAFIGDDTVLPRDAIPRARTELDRLFGGHRLPVAQATSPDCNGCTTAPSASSAEVLHEYAMALRASLATNTLTVRISDDDARRLSATLDELLTWLHSPTAFSGDAQPRPNSGATDAALADRDEAARARLRALRRLHWGAAAAAAIAQLRDDDGEC